MEKYREHAEAGDWYHAENSLKAFITTGNSGSAMLNAVMRTGVHTETVDSLRKAAAGGDTNAAILLAHAESHIGADVGHIAEPHGSGSVTEWKPFPGDVTTYAVTDLPRLLLDLAPHYGVRRDVLCQWYTHWETQGFGSELITVLEPRLLTDKCRDDDLHELLDMAFKTKLTLEGANAAFPYIVQAQLARGGWLGPMFMERREVTEERLRHVVNKYRRRCDEFFLKSAYSWYESPKRSRIIPSDLMVFFLCLQGRAADAVRLAEAMVRSVQEDTRTLQLERPEWAKTLAEARA